MFEVSEKTENKDDKRKNNVLIKLQFVVVKNQEQEVACFVINIIIDENYAYMNIYYGYT